MSVNVSVMSPFSYVSLSHHQALEMLNPQVFAPAFCPALKRNGRHELLVLLQYIHNRAQLHIIMYIILKQITRVVSDVLH